MSTETINHTPITELYEVVRHITRPLLKLDSEPRFLRFDGVIFKADPVRKGGKVVEDGKEMPPPLLADVFDLGRSLDCQIIVNEVLNSELNKHYPDNAYVGKIFRVAKSKLEGRKYATFEIQEVKLKTPPAAAPTAPVTDPASVPATVGKATVPAAVPAPGPVKANARK